MDVEETMRMIAARLDRITAIQETQAGFISGVGLQVGQLASGVDTLAAKIDALADSHARLYGSLQQLTEAQRQLAETQKTTELKLQAFIDSLHRGTDGQ